MNKVQTIVTNALIERIEERRAAGHLAAPWRMTWSQGLGMPRNLVSEKPYRGFNLLVTAWSEYRSPFWVTFNQAKQLGGSVRKGEKSTPIVFWKFDPEGEKPPLCRYYRVFNAEQTEGLAEVQERKLVERLGKRKDVEPIAECERVLRWKGRPPVKHGDSRAYYTPTSDVVSMPEPGAFESDRAYYLTRFHEEVHSTGHPRRLNREGVANPVRFGTHEYSVEELIAETGASMLAAHCGISTEGLLDNSAAYLDSWLRRIKRDPGMLLESARDAQRAVDHILGVSFD